MEHIGEPGCHRAPLPLARGSLVGCTRRTRACCDAVRFWGAVSFNQSRSHELCRADTPSSANTESIPAAPDRNETLPCTPVRTALKTLPLLLGNTMYRFKQEIYSLLAQNLTSPHPLLAASL